MGRFIDAFGTVKTAFKIGKANFSASGVTAQRTITIQDSSHTLVGRDTPDTLTNKRITRRTGSTASSATPSINTDNVDQYILTALAVNITSMSSGLSGTPVTGQLLWITFIPTATRTINWGASFESSTAILPTSITQRTDTGFIYTGSVFRCIAVA